MNERLLMPATKAEKKIVKTAPVVESPKMMDKRLYELEADMVRAEGERRERKGVLKAIHAFLKTPAGKMLQSQALGGALFLGATSNPEAMLNPRIGRADVYEVHNDSDTAEMREELTEWLGAEQVRELIPVETNDEVRAARREMREAPLLEIGAGFEEHDINPEIVRNYLEHGFPRFMVSSTEVSRIDLTTEHVPAPTDYHLPPGSEVAGTCTISPADAASEIRIYGSMFDENGRLEIASTFRQVMIHELGHGMDVTSLSGLNTERRIAMLHQMVEHVNNAGEHLSFSYIESIQHENPQVQLRNRTTEYYAEFISALFQNLQFMYDGTSGRYREVSMPDQHIAESMMESYATTDTMTPKAEARLLNAVRADVRMIRDLIHELDPSFDWAEAYSARRDAIHAMEMTRTTRAIRREIAQIEDGIVRDELERRLEASLETEPAVDDVATFSQRAGTSFAFSRDLDGLRGIDPELTFEARRLEQRVQQEQEHGLREIRSDLNAVDHAASGRLTALLEMLAHTPADELSLSTVQMMVADYRHAAEHATPAHREAAFREMEIGEGIRLSSDLRSSVASLLRRVDDDFASNDQG